LDLSVADALGRFVAPSARAGELLCDQHPADVVALILVSPDVSARKVSFGELARSSRRIAAGLGAIGVGPGDRVATLMGKGLDLVATMLACWRLGAVYVPLFTAFAPAAISTRPERSGAKVIVVDASQRAKLAPSPDMTTSRWQIVVTDPGVAEDGDLEPSALLPDGDTDPFREAAVTPVSEPFVRMFTSGTTGKPKGVVHPFSYVAGWQVYLQLCLGVTDGDIFGVQRIPVGPMGSIRRLSPRSPSAAAASSLKVRSMRRPLGERWLHSASPTSPPRRPSTERCGPPAHPRRTSRSSAPRAPASH
jgi:acetyl-CoA synthetase